MLVGFLAGLHCDGGRRWSGPLQLLDSSLGLPEAAFVPSFILLNSVGFDVGIVSTAMLGSVLTGCWARPNRHFLV